MPRTARHLRLTVAALMYATGETQTDLGRGLGLSQGQISRKQAGTTAWSLAALDRLAAHYGIPAPELLRGADHAVGLLPAARRAACIGATQTTLTPHRPTPPATAPITHDARLTALEADAFRTGRTLAEHTAQLETIREQQTTAFGNIDSLADAIGAPGERTIAQRLDTVEKDLGRCGRTSATPSAC
ncbi:helix-turn-helix domain-containing protein [Streptomyces sp. NPDC015139]|uniref:helix-turn-helix domain-containing protein n=1 Tax=Streptomyces sp. NPDC015139 TaxID=3364942 RepID=UPI0036FD6AE2